MTHRRVSSFCIEVFDFVEMSISLDERGLAHEFDFDVYGQHVTGLSHERPAPSRELVSLRSALDIDLPLTVLATPSFARDAKAALESAKEYREPGDCIAHLEAFEDPELRAGGPDIPRGFARTLADAISAGAAVYWCYDMLAAAPGSADELLRSIGFHSYGKEDYAVLVRELELPDACAESPIK